MIQLHAPKRFSAGPRRRIHPSLLLAAMASSLLALPAAAQTFQTWRSEATSGSWQGSDNWWNFPNPSPIVFGQQEWDNNHFLAQTNLNGGSTFNTWRFLFKSGASSQHTFGGDALRFFDFGGTDPAIINQSGSTHVINNNISGDGDSGDPLLIQIEGGGGLTFGGTINNQGAAINVQGPTASGVQVTFQGVVSGSGGLFKSDSDITLELQAANTFSGQTTIDSGTVRLASSGSLASSDVRIGASGNLTVNNSAQVASVAERASFDGGTITLNSGGTLTINGADKGTLLQNSISGSGNLVMSGSGTTSLSLYGTQSYSGTTTVTGGKISTGVALSTSALTVSGGTFETSAGNILGDTITVTLSGSGNYTLGGSDTIGTLTGSGGSVSLGANTLTTSANASSTFSGTLSGTGGGLTKSGSGTLELAGASANTHTGTTTVSGGTLQLNKTAGVNAIAGAVTVGSTATLLISASDQVADGAAVTLSGGTIQRGTGTVSEVFGNLNLTAASFLDYGASGVGSLQFGTYSPSQLLTVSNFREGSTLIFGSNIGAAVLTDPSRFSFDNAFTSNWNGTTFTITAIPEPSTVAAAVGLAGLLLWPLRRRLFKVSGGAA